MVRWLAVFVAVCLASHAPAAVTLGGFVDTYYAYDFNQPPLIDRIDAGPTQFAVTPSRANEFNVNLAYLDAKLAAENVRARLALQAGTSVQANYFGEDAAPVGKISGSSLARNLQEATVGYRVADGLWVDAGIMLSYIGFESFISRDNWNYSRALMSDFSPYYETGVKASWQASTDFSLQLHLMNGWQTVAETNSNKAVGMQAVLLLGRRLTLTYNNFFGEEVGSLWRFFNDLIAKLVITDRAQLALSADVGFQRKPSGGTSVWQGYGLFFRYQLGRGVSAAARLERFYDPDKVIAQPLTSSYEANGASLNVDCELVSNLFWRNEVRGIFATQAIFPTPGAPSQNDLFVTSSISYTF